MSNGPVFFDPSGMRRTRVTRGLWALATVASVAGTLFVLSLISIPFLAPSTDIATARLRRLLPTMPKPHERMSLILMNRERDKLWADIAASSERRAKRLAASKSISNARIVATFYAAWNPNELKYLTAEADKLTHVIPTWLQLDKSGASLNFTDYTPRAARDVIDLAHVHGIALCPELSNVSNGQFEADRVTRLLDSKAAQQALIRQTVGWLKANGCQGLNVDFENLKPNDYDRLPAFLTQFAGALHASGLSPERRHRARAGGLRGAGGRAVRFCGCNGL